MEAAEQKAAGFLLIPGFSGIINRKASKPNEFIKILGKEDVTLPCFLIFPI